MDFIRLELTFKSNLYQNTIKKGITPILASQKLIYKKPLKLWDTFTITLKNEGWDNKWVYHSHIFKKDNDIYAIGYTKVGFWKNKQLQELTPIINNCNLKKPHRLPNDIVTTIFKNDSEYLKSKTNS